MSKYGRAPIPAFSRVMARVTKQEDGCWIFHGGTARGYGRVMTGSVADGTRRGRYAHVIVYEEIVGQIPNGMELDHLCRVPLCVNPEHLEAVTHKENVLRGKSRSAESARLTACRRGHEFTVENTKLDANGGRRCRTCDLAWRRERYRTLRERSS